MTTREPLQIVELDIDYCDNVFGSSPCTAALSADCQRKCFNTYFTCADRANFSAGTKTLRFSRPINGLPMGLRIYPALKSDVKISGTEVNLGGVGDRIGSLGKRARVTVSLRDFTDTDIGLDRYQAERVSGAAQFDGAGYQPKDRGTFFGRLRARFPYYEGRALRIRDGYVGDALEDMATRHFVVTQWTGPDASGNVQITAKDVLDLADNKKALCPSPSNGKLAEDISATFLGEVDLAPETVGEEYAESGRISLGSEIVRFTRSGDTLTIVERAVDGSEAASHAQDDLAQQCYRVEGEDIADVAADLMENYAGIDAAFLPTSDWADEAAHWLAGFRLTTTITKPTGVTTLLGELAHFGVMWWWDAAAGEIKMRANRPADFDEQPESFVDEKHFIGGKSAVEDLDNKRISRVLFWHGRSNAAKSATDGDSYSRLAVAADIEAESANEYGQDRTFEVFSRWLGRDGNNSVASAVSGRLLSRYRDTPKQITFEVDRKEHDRLSIGSLLYIQSRLIQDPTGGGEINEFQAVALEEDNATQRLKVKAQSSEFSGRFGFIMENTANDYAGATDAEKAKGLYIVDETTLEFPDGTGAYILF